MALVVELTPFVAVACGGAMAVAVAVVGAKAVTGAGTASGFTAAVAGLDGDLPSALAVLAIGGLACGAGLEDGFAGVCFVDRCIVFVGSAAAIGFVLFGATCFGVAAAGVPGAGLGLGFTPPRRNLIGAALAARFSLSVGCAGSSTFAFASANRSVKYAYLVVSFIKKSPEQCQTYFKLASQCIYLTVFLIEFAAVLPNLPHLAFECIPAFQFCETSGACTTMKADDLIHHTS